MRIVIAPDSFGGTLRATEAAAAIATGWARTRPEDELIELPLSDGGEGLLDALASGGGELRRTEVAGPLGHPRDASWLLQADGTAVIESAEACGLVHVPEERRSPLRTTTYGVGQLIDAARDAGARRILVGLGGSATVDGGAGALLGLGFRLSIEDGSGLKVGSEDLGRVIRAERGWSATFDEVEVVLLSDVTTTLVDAAPVFGPQKGATSDEVATLTSALESWAEVAERDLAGGRRWRDVPGSGAAGGLGFGLACALGARFVPGARTVADLVGLEPELEGVAAIVTGEGRLDATSGSGKVIDLVREVGARRGIPILAVVGQVAAGAPALDGLEAAAPDGPGDDPRAEVEAAAARLAGTVSAG